MWLDRTVTAEKYGAAAKKRRKEVVDGPSLGRTYRPVGTSFVPTTDLVICVYAVHARMSAEVQLHASLFGNG